MSRTLQVRDVPDELADRLKARAAADGRSLSDYVLRILEEHVSVPTRAEVMEQLRNLPPVQMDEDPRDILRRMREG